MLWAVVLYLPAVAGVLSARFSALHCRREPADTLVPRSPGSNGFGIYVSSNPVKYVPQEKYTVTLRGQRAVHDQVFIGFVLALERQDPASEQEVGSLQLTNRDLTKFSVDCPHAITHSSNLNKNQVSVIWTAPPPGSGCVVFRATVIERKDVWRMDDGPLSKVFCEEEQSVSDELPEILEQCCACDEAKYEVTFEGLWSRYTHPKDFPPNEWLTHFSDLIGATHTTDYRIFDYGGLASEGLRLVAEQGSAKSLESELKGQPGKIRTIIKARGLWYPNVTGKTFAVFRTDREHHLMSVVSMLGPSPDWFVGVSGLELCLTNCSWAGELTLPLYPLDAGTNSLNTYMGTRNATVPQERIKRITSTNMRDSPFFDPTGAPMKPVARLIVSRQRVYDKSCLDDPDFISPQPPPYVTPPTDFYREDDRPECQTTEWTRFTPCSVTCGEGVRMRSRSYVHEPKARMVGCGSQLTEKKLCGFPCVGDVSCETSPWTRWSECSVTCGKGHRSRTRKYLDTRGNKACKLELVEREMCLPSEDCQSTESPIPPGCDVTQWSEWSPCTATCGKGRRVRTRLYLSVSAVNRCHVELLQHGPCMAEKQDCEIDPSEASEACQQAMEPGPCRGFYPRWYYNSTMGLCLQFAFHGCRGNRNNFEHYNDCFKTCQMRFGKTSRPGGPVPQAPQGPIHCMVTPWSDWSPCSGTCGKARKTRRRMIKQNPQHGGRPCPKKLLQRRKCADLPPCQEGQHTKRAAVDCAMSPWGEWMPCLKTCGHAVQQRSREVQRQQRHGGAPCGPKWERKYCDLPPCPPASS